MYKYICISIYVYIYIQWYPPYINDETLNPLLVAMAHLLMFDIPLSPTSIKWMVGLTTPFQDKPHSPHLYTRSAAVYQMPPPFYKKTPTAAIQFWLNTTDVGLSETC